MSQITLLSFGFQHPTNVWKLAMNLDAEFARQCLGWMRHAKGIDHPNVRLAMVEVTSWQDWANHVRVLAIEPGYEQVADEFDDAHESFMEPTLIAGTDMPEWVEDITDTEEQYVSFVVSRSTLWVRFQAGEVDGYAEFTAASVTKRQLKRAVGAPFPKRRRSRIDRGGDAIEADSGSQSATADAALVVELQSGQSASEIGAARDTGADEPTDCLRGYIGLRNTSIVETFLPGKMGPDGPYAAMISWRRRR